MDRVEAGETEEYIAMATLAAGQTNVALTDGTVPLATSSQVTLGNGNRQRSVPALCPIVPKPEGQSSRGELEIIPESGVMGVSGKYRE